MPAYLTDRHLARRRTVCWIVDETGMSRRAMETIGLSLLRLLGIDGRVVRFAGVDLSGR